MVFRFIEICYYKWDNTGFENGDLWLTQKAISELYDCSTDNVGLHLKNIYNDMELDKDSTTEDFSVVQKEGNREVKRNIKYYNLDAVIFYKSDFDKLMEENEIYKTNY